MRDSHASPGKDLIFKAHSHTSTSNGSIPFPFDASLPGKQQPEFAGSAEKMARNDKPEEVIDTFGILSQDQRALCSGCSGKPRVSASPAGQGSRSLQLLLTPHSKG